MTELGRRCAILAGTAAFAISVVIGLLSQGDLMRLVVTGALGGVIFGIGGLLVGNLLNGYILNAAKREVTRAAIERELAQELSRREPSEEETSTERSEGIEA